MAIIKQNLDYPQGTVFVTLAEDNEDGYYIAIGTEEVKSYACCWPVQWYQKIEDRLTGKLYIPFISNDEYSSKSIWVDTCVATIPDTMIIKNTDPTELFLSNETIHLLEKLIERNYDDPATNNEHDNAVTLVSSEMLEFTIRQSRPVWKLVSFLFVPVFAIFVKYLHSIILILD